MPENSSHRQGLEDQRLLLEEELYRLYGPEYVDGRRVSETLTRLRAKQGVSGFNDHDRADLRKVRLVLDRMEAVAQFYNPDQPRDHGRWTSGGALPNAVKYLERKAGTSSTDQCARFVREALKEDGIDLKPADRPTTGSAKDYGPTFEKYGFERVAPVNQGVGYPPYKEFKAETGDVVVIQGISGHKHGHMAMWTGSRWVSDFKQPNFWPHGDYATAKPPYVIYRYKKKG